MGLVVVVQVGDDPMGDVVMRELEDDGVDTSGVIRAAGHPTPFTYIIVDREGESGAGVLLLLLLL
jgi:sugar/nucleoside kinase (ribokinase family)